MNDIIIEQMAHEMKRSLQVLEKKDLSKFSEEKRIDIINLLEKLAEEFALLDQIIE